VPSEEAKMTLRSSRPTVVLRASPIGLAIAAALAFAMVPSS
jgi:hypothetical protein